MVASHADRQALANIVREAASILPIILTIVLCTGISEGMLLEVASALAISASFSLVVGACDVGRGHSGAGREAGNDGGILSVMQGPGIA